MLLQPGRACLSASSMPVPGSGLPAPRDCETELSVIRPPISWCRLTAPGQGGHPSSGSVGKIETQRRWGLSRMSRQRGAKLGLAPGPVRFPSQPVCRAQPRTSRGWEAAASPSPVPDPPRPPRSLTGPHCSPHGLGCSSAMGAGGPSPARQLGRMCGACVLPGPEEALRPQARPHGPLRGVG